jgi:MoaA/NifB/PqqE/SkfB family radical SAM enzyme
MNPLHDKFCVLPWVSLETSPIGTVRPCCLADDEIVDNNGKKFHLTSANFLEVQNSDYMKNLRAQFIAGEQPATCRRCWQEEESGRTSKRMHTLDRLKHMLSDQSWTVDAKPLMFLDLKLGNICNLKCRICGSWSSSQFAVEEMAALPANEDKKKSYAYQMLRAGSWPQENQQFWSEIDLVSDQIRYIEFTGGEPFMITEHFDMLENLIEKGIANQIEIHYNTNGTQWPVQAEEIWKHFKTVEIAFSIDDVEQRFEYQRTNAVWTEVIDNIKKYQDLRARNSNIRLQVCCTVNVFNVRYLDTVANWIARQNFNFVYWNIMHDAWYFSIARLPDSAKAGIIEHLSSSQIPFSMRKEFDNIIDFMKNGSSSDGMMTRRIIRQFDRKRNQNLKDVAPELAKLLNYE